MYIASPVKSHEAPEPDLGKAEAYFERALSVARHNKPIPGNYAPP